MAIVTSEHVYVLMFRIVSPIFIFHFSFPSGSGRRRGRRDDGDAQCSCAGSFLWSQSGWIATDGDIRGALLIESF